jgi:hypothetical protein
MKIHVDFSHIFTGLVAGAFTACNQRIFQEYPKNYQNVAGNTTKSVTFPTAHGMAKVLLVLVGTPGGGQSVIPYSGHYPKHPKI